jgi:hypothetical protein
VHRSIATTLACSLVLGALGLATSACGGPPPKMVATTKDDGVPANSASEERLASDGKPKTTSAPAAEDPTQPYTTPLSGDPSAASSGGGGAGSGGSAGAAPAGKGGKGGAKDPPAPKGGGAKVTKAECKQLFDKYIDLSVGSDSRFEGIPPEMIAQLKESALAQAQSQKGDPCSTQQVTRPQYNCAISAASTTAWQRCMK